MAPQHSDLLDTVHAQEAARTVPEHIVVSAWSEHAPFAFWLAATLRPRVFVELGTHWGFSYFAFCQKFAELKTGTRCFAIDTWMGDEHASHYGEDVYQTVTQRNEHYRDFSTLLRSTFDDALDRIEDKSVDLLHIDGRHFYDDVKHDFESWVPKLSDDAIVLFHDTMVFERNFGVWKFFGELKKKHPTFEFTHCHGLGVLAIKNVPTALEKLLSANNKKLTGVHTMPDGSFEFSQMDLH